MRRAFAVAAVALPAALAVAQVPPAAIGQVLEINNFEVETGNNYINAAHCAGTDQLDLEWQITSFSGTGTYQIVASNTQPGTAGATGNFCPDNAPNATPAVHTGQVQDFEAKTPVQRGSVSGAQAVSVALDPETATSNCGPSGERKIVYICAHFLDAGSNKVGAASGKFIVQVKAPAVPTNVSAASGNGRLQVSWDPGAGGDVVADSYVASASTVAGGPAIASASTDTESVAIGGLANFTQYFVRVRALSVGGNPSGDSAEAAGTPMPSAGFLDIYDGVEDGGCASGPGGALALLGTALAFALRRRTR
jgi:hypothetical protein